MAASGAFASFCFAAAGGAASPGVADAPFFLFFFRPFTSGRSAFATSATSSRSPASLSSSLRVSPGLSSGVPGTEDRSTSLMVSRVLSVSPASEMISLVPAPSLSETPLTPVSDAAEDAVSEARFLRSTRSPGGLGRRQMGNAGESVAWMEMVCTGVFSRCLTTWLITAAAFAIRCSSGMLHLPILIPMEGPAGMRSGVPRMAFSIAALGSETVSRTGMGALRFFW
mmetsp:Transcript_4222/g.11319  ORF Transcript_4222/g.11319 Transcript_4222/m.11319 type:complete len:226 (-) Transcript_4222:526-1203(-)